jgi:hypothetical protein
MFTRRFLMICFFLGLALLSINLMGLFIPLGNPKVESAINAPQDGILPLISPEEFYAVVNEKEKSEGEYITKINWAVSQVMVHYWDEAGVDQYNLRIPIYENYLLFLAGVLRPGADRRYEFCDYRKAIERRVGFCSQQALIFNAVLSERGIHSKIISFPWLHVVATAQVDQNADAWWIFDPDFGVVIPYSIEEIARKPDLILPYYRDAGYDASLLNYLEYIYGTPSFITSSVDEYFGLGKCDVERLTYRAIWVLPIVFIILGMYPLVVKRLRR